MIPQAFKTQQVFNPDYFGGSGALVKGFGQPYEKFDYIMTEAGVMNVLRTMDERGGAKLDKTPLCEALDAVLWPNGMPKKNIHLTVLKGPSGCGKSTYAREMVAQNRKLVRVNRDSLRAMGLGRWLPEAEKLIVRWQLAMIEEAYKNGYSVVIDDTNLTEKTVEMWHRAADKLGFRFSLFDVYLNRPDHSLAMCLNQDAKRTGKERIGRPVIERQFLIGKYIEWGTKPVVFVDMDGTLADLAHREHLVSGICTHCTRCDNHVCCECGGTGKVKKDYYNFFKRCIDDKPVPAVVEWVQELYKTHTICIVSGRSMDLAGEESIEWLNRHDIPFDHIYMRNGQDYRPDVIVKQQILDDILASGLPKEQIAFCIDDRLSVVEMWRKNGLKVYPVRCREVEFA